MVPALSSALPRIIMIVVAPAQSVPDFYTGLRGRPVVEAIVCGLPIWVQLFLMQDRCKQQPKTTEVVHRCKKVMSGLITAHI